MIEVNKFYDLINKAYKLKVGNLNKINCYNYGDGFKYKNIIFILHENTKGKCVNIWIYENENISDVLQDNHLEVYGAIKDPCGWTEQPYGWIHYYGSWNVYITKYLDNLEKLIYEIELKNKVEIKSEEEKNLENQLFKFHKIFLNCE